MGLKKLALFIYFKINFSNNVKIELLDGGLCKKLAY